MSVCDLSERLNWKQACALLGCTKSTLFRLVKEGKLPAYGVGQRGRWYLRSDCNYLIEQDKNPHSCLTN